ncbi:MAG: hypothetical protein A2513_09585 [Sulfurimonas sp. RIFOXYD12_FULL_33_39]|uniref:hypothetical protein n=1 Tax=unclassified Sulfurimonas TaxID=2623549 RepID=UPI0008D81532|nr:MULTISPECIES: hypothetical protein [unclassified Sulfurimonas]OHE10697.1 MAG: hypothetical protein A2513_09585 [Sulfurimonas sp. RIFOXYD12_FULL_33_39]OHE13210.1 MAG: hypothetical protein A2530_11175 [Sulfurimonas sp. RIFOXYD2_FULL_34_21]
MKKDDIKNIPHISGIDALYYFAQSGGGYDAFYENIIEQIDNKKAEFNTLNYAYADNDIIITLNNIDIKYSGMGRDGFLWFNHDFFRVGFKDSEKAQNIHNIRVQLNAIGIYTIGIESLVKYINTQLLCGALLSTNYFPVTRIDVNMFIEHNFNYLRKEMILSKKKSHSANITERSSGYELETYYVGKKPFMLRIYNKLKELETSSEIKRELMHNYFGVNGLDINKPIFNVEFEYHREVLKNYAIDTIEDALIRSQSLFELGCNLVKVIDISTLTTEQLNSSNKRRAPLSPIWEYISTHYDNKEFMQITTPLEKIEKISYRYSLEDARKPIKRQITRLLLHENSPTLLYFYELLQSAEQDYKLRQNIKEFQKDNSENNSAITVLDKFEDDLKKYSNEGLINFEKALSKDMRGIMPNDALYDELLHKYDAIDNELIRRGIRKVPF